MKEKFGFIQPLGGDEQVYFADKQGYSGISVGDEVCFIKRAGSKGFSAERLRLINVNAKEVIQDIKGVVFREADVHRGTPGLIQLSEEALQNTLAGIKSDGATKSHESSKPLVSITQGHYLVPYFVADVGTSSNEKSPSANSTNRRIVKGDEVSFTMAYIANKGYLRASAVVCLRRKKDRMMAEQIQRMLGLLLEEFT